MEEILQYLHKRDGYALFAGFAAFLLTGVEPSPDIDIFVSSRNDVQKIADDFIPKGWNVQRTEEWINTVEKNGTTLDIVFSDNAKKAFLPCKIAVPFKGKKLFSVTPEALLLTKMNQLTSQERSDDKTKRDRKVIYQLRKEIQVKKLKMLLENLEDTFWTEGYF
jgi:hypothetical protein